MLHFLNIGANYDFCFKRVLKHVSHFNSVNLLMLL